MTLTTTPPVLSDGKNAAYVHRLSAGHTRYFFNVSVPRTWLEGVVDEQQLVRAPDEVCKQIAKLIEQGLAATR